MWSEGLAGIQACWKLELQGSSSSAHCGYAILEGRDAPRAGSLLPGPPSVLTAAWSSVCTPAGAQRAPAKSGVREGKGEEVLYAYSAPPRESLWDGAVWLLVLAHPSCSLFFLPIRQPPLNWTHRSDMGIIMRMCKYAHHTRSKESSESLRLFH